MKTWKILGLLTLLMLGGMAMDAQNDVVRLQDGSFIRGTIIEYIAGHHVRIQTLEGKVYEYAAADIKATEMGVIGGHTTKSFTPKTKGFYNITGLGLAFGNNYGRLATAPGLYTVNGWQWNKHLMTGIGAGVEYLNNAVRVPLMLDARWKFGNSNFQPFVGLNAGYTLSGQQQTYYYYDIWGGTTEVNKGGITTGAQVGFVTQVAQHVGLSMSLGYRYQQFTRIYDQGFWNGMEIVPMPVTEKSDLNRVTLGFGLLFN